MKRNSFIYIFGLIILLSCNENSKLQNTKNKSISLIPTDTVVLHLPPDVKYNGHFQTYKYNQKECLGVNIWRENRVVIFDKKNGNVLDDFVMKSEGADGVGDVRGFHYLNNDSIFVIKKRSNKIFMINSKSEVKSKWELSNAKNIKFNNAVYASTNNFPLTFHNNKLYCKKFTDSYFGSVPYQNDNHLVIFNIKDTTVFNKTYSFPQEYDRNIKYNIDSYQQSCQINNKGNAIVCFYLTPDIYLYSDTGLIQSYHIPSRFVDEYGSYPKTDISKNLEARENFDIQKGNYRWIKYDKKRDYTIRLVLHKSELYDAEGNKNRLYDKEFSLQIINNKFELIGEQKFEKNLFYLWNIIPVEEGLLISINNDKNPNLEEDKLKFVLYKYSNEKI